MTPHAEQRVSRAFLQLIHALAEAEVLGFVTGEEEKAQSGPNPAPSAVPSAPAEQIPFELRAIDAQTVGVLLGLAHRTVLEKVACRPDFPVRLSMRPSTWIAGEVLAWRDSSRAKAKGRRHTVAR